MENKDKKQKLSEEEVKKQQAEKRKEDEIHFILEKTDENDAKEESLNFDEENKITVKNQVKEMAHQAIIDNPDKKYETYYGAIRKIFRKYLPKGDKCKKARHIIYEEANTFLAHHRKDKNGIRHADSRMGYLEDMNELIDILIDWVFAKGSIFELYTKLKDKNDSKGYGKQV